MTIKNLSKSITFLLFFFISFQFSIKNINAEDPPFPKIGYPCDGKGKDPEFNSLRPYQAASCGEANKASFCSNELQFTETFNMAGKGNCNPKGYDSTFTCNPNFVVNKHILYIDLAGAMLPILGNTELTQNHLNNGDKIDDAQKTNEYVSWYLSGVNNKAEYGTATQEQVVNFSGPVQKILPKLIQEVQRINVINTAKKDGVDTLNHDQIVVCGNEPSFGWLGDILGIGITKPLPCYNKDRYRLSDWNGDLSMWNSVANGITGLVNAFADLNPLIPNDIINDSIGNHWNKRIPPLPWSNENGQPFESELLYQKAYNEWQGRTCVLIPVVNQLICLDNVFVPNKYAELYNFIPLANTTDKTGSDEIVGVDLRVENGTKIEQNGSTPYYNSTDLKSAPLYFAHTQEVLELSKLLNTTYQPKDYVGGRVNTTEPLTCSAVNVRTNPGDNLFAGERASGDDGMIIPDVTYKITEAKCVEKVNGDAINTPINPNACPGLPLGNDCVKTTSFECEAEVLIAISTDTETPNASAIYSQTVADSGSIFRKIFPKVEKNAPVSCIADIPAVTAVTYDSSLSQKPNGGDQTFGVAKYPTDSGGLAPELSFAHVGSIYEYFLKGIQTALRPKGYGEPIVSGKLCNNLTCGVLPDLPKGVGSCNLTSVSPKVGRIPPALKKIVSAAAQTYSVPPALILGIMFGEGGFNAKYQWTEENAINWATCELLPSCNGPDTSIIPFFEQNWNEIARAIKPDLRLIDPNKKEPDPCNLLDVVYAVAWDLRRNGFGAPDFAGHTCFGIALNSGTSTNMNGCSWDSKDIETAIRWWEFGTAFNNTYTCATLTNSCLTGGGASAACPTGDNCETINFRYSQPSHNACVWDVAHGN